MANTNLKEAKAAKNDEFYTQFHDIEIEMNAYLECDPDVFRGKTVLLPCDDPEWSNFTRFFAAKFDEFIIGKTNRDEIQNQMRLKFARKLQKRNVTEKSHTSYSLKWLSNVN